MDDFSLYGLSAVWPEADFQIRVALHSESARETPIIYQNLQLPHSMVPLRVHDDREVVAWCRSGRTEMRIDDEPVLLEPGDAVWISPGTPHSAVMDVNTVQIAAFLNPDPMETIPHPPKWLRLRSASELIGSLLQIAHGDSFVWPMLSDSERRAMHRTIRAAFLGAAPTAEKNLGHPALRWTSRTRRPFLLSCSRGSAAISFQLPGERRREVRIGRDHALVLPRGAVYLVHARPGSVVTPAVIKPGVPDPTPTAPRLTHLPTAMRAEMHYNEFAWVSGMTPIGIPKPALGVLAPSALTDIALTDPDEDSPAWRVQRIQRALHNRPGYRATVPDWAAHFGVAVRSIENAFTNHAGMSFSDWRQELRMQRAIDWLDEGRQAKWISHQLGFSHLSAFSRAFANYAGMTARDRQALAREQLIRVR